MFFVWLLLVLPPTLVFAYVALSGLSLLVRSGLKNPQSRTLWGSHLVFATISSGYLLSFHEASKPMWGLVGQLVSQIMLQLGPIASASTIADQSTTLHQLDWLGESTAMLLPIIERNAPLSHLIAVVLGLFMSSFVTFMTASLKQRKIPEYMYVYLSLYFFTPLGISIYLQDTTPRVLKLSLS